MLKFLIMVENSPGTLHRNRPTAVQRRGLERVEAILDAAEELLAEQGYEAATLKAIGERAHIPTASLYHYFADRSEVEAELAERHIAEMDEHLRNTLRNIEPRTLTEAVDAIIDPLLEYLRSTPSFVQLWFTGRGPALAVFTQSFNQRWAEWCWKLLTDRRFIALDTPAEVISIAFAACDCLFDLAFLRSKTGDPAIIAEARRMAISYLATYSPKQEKI